MGYQKRFLSWSGNKNIVVRVVGSDIELLYSPYGYGHDYFGEKFYHSTHSMREKIAKLEGFCKFSDSFRIRRVNRLFGGYRYEVKMPSHADQLTVRFPFDVANPDDKYSVQTSEGNKLLDWANYLNFTFSASSSDRSFSFSTNEETVPFYLMDIRDTVKS